MESTEVPYPEKKGIASFVARRGRELMHRVINRIEVDELDSHAVAIRIIAKRHSVQTRKIETVGRLNPNFTIVPVLGACGYQAIGEKSDYAKLYPEAYEKVRQILTGFVKEGILTEQFLARKDLNNEITCYDYADIERLKDMAFAKKSS